MTWQQNSNHHVPGSLGAADRLSKVTSIHKSREAAHEHQGPEEAARGTTHLHPAGRMGGKQALLLRVAELDTVKEPVAKWNWEKLS